MEAVNVMKLNTNPVTFPAGHSFYMQEIVAPKTSCDLIEGEDGTELYTRIVAFIDSKAESIGAVIGNLNEEGQLPIEVTFSLHPQTATSFNIWLVDVRYVLSSSETIREVISTVKNEDPKTSRGTLTVVQKQ